MPRGSERKRIRNKIVEILRDASIPGVDADVFSQRSVPTAHETLPTILVYQKSESNERHDQTPKTYQRFMQLEIEIQTTHDNDAQLADEMDDLSQHVENAIEQADKILLSMKDDQGDPALINDYNLLSSLYDVNGDASNPIGTIRLIYQFEYYTNEERPEHLDNFEKMETTFKANDNQNMDAKDVQEFPTA
tara:strand:+ start:7115 stop:7687 length:573 start_codon:yes stop_codon:yes gene_type:complete